MDDDEIAAMVLAVVQEATRRVRRGQLVGLEPTGMAVPPEWECFVYMTEDRRKGVA